jgi:hypothetical protein
MIAVCTLVEMTLRADASVLRGIPTTGIVLHGRWCMGLLTMKTRSHESWRGSCCSAEARRSAHTVTVPRLAWMGTHPSMASGVAPDSQWVLGEADTNTSLVAVVQLYTIQLVECMRCISNVLILDETHGTVLLCAEAKSLEPSAFGEQRLQLVLAGVDRQVPNVQSVARGVLISGIGRRIVMLQVHISARSIASVGASGRTSGWSRQGW